MSPYAVLIGAPGAGKSTVGAALATAKDRVFIDTDVEIEASTAMTVGQLFVEQGEAHFRELERLAVVGALANHGAVVALGGGAVLDPTTRAALADHQVVWLRVGLAEAANRVGLNAARPLLLGNVRGRLKALLDERNTLYEQVAVQIIDTADRTVEDLVELITQALGDSP